jgi:uncharacterized membrane protein
MEALIGLVVLLVVVAPLTGIVLSLTLRRRVRELELRLLLLENERARAGRAAESLHTPDPPDRVGARAASVPDVSASRPPQPVAPRAPVRPSAPEPVRVAAPPVVAAAPSEWKSLEQRLGGTWLNRVGALVLTLGIAFFLKYAFDNQWIQPAGRVALGLITGVALLLLGERLQRAAYRAPAQGVVAVGIATLYLSVYAAFAFYQLVTQPAAFAFMVLVTATAAALALYHDARAVAVLANLGGFLTPILLSTNRDAGTALFTYLAVLDAGMLVVAWYRRWPELGLMSFVFTQALYAAWFERWYHSVPPQQGVALVAAGVFLVLFSLVAPAEALSRRLPARAEQLWHGPGVLALAAPVAAFIVARQVLYPAHATALALACLVLAAYYLVLAYATAEAPGVGPHLLMIHGGVSLAFLTLTFPVQFAEHGLAIAWSVEALAIVWGGLRLEARPLRLGGLVVLGLAVGRWVTLLDDRAAHNGAFLLDHRALLSTVALVAASALAAVAYHAGGRGLRDGERFVEPALALTAVIGATAFVTVELQRHAALGLDRFTLALVVTLVWLAAGVLTLGLVATDRTAVLFTAATIMLGLVGLLAIGGDAERWHAERTLTPIVNLRFLTGLLITAVYALYAGAVAARGPSAHQARPLHAAGVGAAALFLLWHLSVEIVLLPLEGATPGEVTMAHHMGLSILWTLYAFAAMGIGLQRRHSALRLGAIGLFALTVAKVFLVDLGRLDAGYRILSFVVLGGLLILASFLYTRYRERLSS